MINIDTWRMLDKCSECGAYAGFELDKSTYKVRAGCSDGCSLGEWKDSLYDAIVPWNLAQRKDRPQKDIPPTVLPKGVLEALALAKKRRKNRRRKTK